MRIVVIRTSAMGDVALTVPVLNALRQQYPDAETVLVTRKLFNAFFRQDRSLIIFNPDFKGRHKGFFGIIRLCSDLSAMGEIDHVVDIHDVLRTKILRLLFRLRGVKVSVIDKGRKEKKNLISGKRKIKLKHTVERYNDAFSRAGLDLVPVKGQSITVSKVAGEAAAKLIGDSDVKNIGIAPFAMHQLKMWPEKNMIDLAGMISRDHKVRFWFFGGKDEKVRTSSLTDQIPGSVNLCGKLTLEEELALMSRLDLMIAMDSSNMHMAALCGTKVISIWGGTDPLAGFGAWQQPEEFSVRIPVEELTCRPCTVFGSGTCKRGDLACMNWLTPSIVYHKIISLDIL
jgi:ADP-heptose:LPS heptosyltransferase